jgi:ABC-2 type transport system ATP-binding protein
MEKANPSNSTQEAGMADGSWQVPGQVDPTRLEYDTPAGTWQRPAAVGTMLLEIENITVKFGKFTAVRGAGFELRAGSLLGLIGPNGAGKTTLLRSIASLQPMVKGTVKVLGRPVQPGDEEAARMIGFTPDVPPAYEALTVRQFLNFIAAGYGITPENTGPIIDFWLEKVWLQDKKAQKVKGLSRGMRQRLGIARTLLANPQIILLDEPAAGLDPAGRVQFRKLLTDLRDQGKTLIVSSHILSDMEEYCTHAAIMSHGTIMKFGTVREIAAGVDDGRRRYTLELAEPVAKIAELLAEIEDVSHVQAERLQVTLEYWSEKHRAAELLRELMKREVPVAGFSVNAAGLEEAYLRAGIRQVD